MMLELQIKFYLWQNEDCSPGDSISDSSEKLFQRGGGGGKGSIYVIFGEGGIHAIKHIFLQKVSTSLVKPLLVIGNSHYHEGF